MFSIKNFSPVSNFLVKVGGIQVCSPAQHYVKKELWVIFTAKSIFKNMVISGLYLFWKSTRESKL